jgi:predicted amidophosphoribosyltransferase
VGVAWTWRAHGSGGGAVLDVVVRRRTGVLMTCPDCGKRMTKKGDVYVCGACRKTIAASAGKDERGAGSSDMWDKMQSVCRRKAMRFSEAWAGW